MYIDRREFLKISGLGTAVLVLGQAGSVFGLGSKTGMGDFMFVQISDTHWGFVGRPHCSDGSQAIPGVDFGSAFPSGLLWISPKEICDRGHSSCTSAMLAMQLGIRPRHQRLL